LNQQAQPWGKYVRSPSPLSEVPGESAPPAPNGHQIARENGVLRQLIEVYRYLSNLAGQGAGLDEVAELIAERLSTAVAVIDDGLMVLAAAEAGGSAEDAGRFLLGGMAHPQLQNIIGVVGATHRALRMPGTNSIAPIIVAPISVGDMVSAYLLTLDDCQNVGDSDLSLLLSEHAATICGVILGRQRVIAGAATQARQDLVEGLLSGQGSDAEDICRWAAHLGYDEKRPHRVLSIALDDAPEQPGLARRARGVVEHFLTAHAPDAITAVRGREVVVIMPETNADASGAVQLATASIDRVREALNDTAVTVGVGGICRSALDISASYNDARRTVDIIRRMGRSGIALAVEDLGIHRLLLQVADPSQLRDFVREVFGGILETSHNDQEYLATLACYFRANNSPQRAARELHVHPNTVAYRLKRVEHLTNLDLSRYRDRLMAQVAVEILDAVGGTL